MKSFTAKPYHLTYILLLTGSVIITLCALRFDPTSQWFSIVTSVGSGGIASVVVAWLIDISSCKRAKENAEKHRAVLLSNLKNAFYHGVQMLILESTGNTQCSESKKWYEWVDAATAKAEKNEKSLPSIIRRFKILFDSIAEQAMAIKGQESVLLEAGIICERDVQAISTILGFCDLSQNSYYSRDNDKECLRHLKMCCELLKQTVNYAPSLRSINEMDVKSTLSTIRTVSGELKEEAGTEAESSAASGSEKA